MKFTSVTLPATKKRQIYTSLAVDLDWMFCPTADFERQEFSIEACRADISVQDRSNLVFMPIFDLDLILLIFVCDKVIWVSFEKFRYAGKAKSVEFF